MTTYTLQGLASHSVYDLVLVDGFFEQVTSVLDIAATTVKAITRGSTTSTSYAIDANYGQGIEITPTGFGTAYALNFAALNGYKPLAEATYSSIDLITVAWDGGAKNATVLDITVEWNDWTNNTGESVTFSTVVTGDALPSYSTVAEYQAFVLGATTSAQMPVGFREGDVISLSSIDAYVGQTENDVIRGSRADETFLGGVGKDWISGLNGNDSITGDGGNDTIYGGNGKDTVHGGAGHDVINGGDQRDRLIGDFGNDSIDGGKGADYVLLGGGKDVFHDVAQGGATGSDTVEGGLGNDRIYGGGGNDLFLGQAHNDRIWGGKGNDTLNAGAGNDKLFGGRGADVLISDVGNDTLTGGGGADSFVFTALRDVDANVITDYTVGVDHIDLPNFIQNHATFEIVDTDILLTRSNGGTILIEGVTDLTAVQDDIFGVAI